MSDIELTADLRNLAANPAADVKANASELLRLVCRRLKFTIGVYARVQRRPSVGAHDDRGRFHVQLIHPGDTPISSHELVELERWLDAKVQAVDRSTEQDDLALSLSDHPFHTEDGCRYFVGVPVSSGGVLEGVFGFFHTCGTDAWSPSAENSFGIMMSWFVERLVRVETGFSMLPAAELEQKNGLAGLEMFRSTTQQFVLVMDPSGYLLEANRALMKFENKAPAEIQGVHFCDLSLGEFLIGGASLLRGAISEANEKRSAHRELVMDGRGEGRTFQLSIKRVTHPYTSKVMLLGEMLELTEHFRAIKQFEAQVTVLKAVFNQSTNFIGLLEPDGSLIIANQRALDFIEATNESLRGQKLWELPWFFDMDSTQNRFRQAVAEVAAGGTVRFEVIIKGSQSRVMSIEFTMKPLFDEDGKVLFLLPEGHDLTPQIAELNDRMVSERAIQEKVRMQSLGVLAGGVAHDFNNLLTCILGNASLLKMESPAASESYLMLHEIEGAARRSASLCQQMLAFSGHGQIAMQLCSISSIIESSLPDLLTQLGYCGSVRLELDDDLPEVLLDERQLVQLLSELVTNAVEAMEGLRGNGFLNIRTRAADERSPTHVMLEVVDNGCGMNANVRTHACEPFFTTKFTGRGLGLAAVSGIVRGHQGRLEIDSTARGGGTTIRVKFPLSIIGSPAEFSSSRPNSSKSSILVVDDDKLVQGVLSRFLAMLGYTSILAGDGVEAMEAYHASQDEIQLVMLDLTMPRMDGFEAFNELRRFDPTLPVILMSGYSEKQSVLRFEDNLAGFLPKPLTFESVKSCLGSVLDGVPKKA